MIRAAAGVVLLLALAEAGAARGEEPGGLDVVPSSIAVYLNESTVLPLPSSASFILSDHSRIDAVRVSEGVKLRGKFLGGAELFVSNGAQTGSVTVTVLLPPTRQFDATGRQLAALRPDELGILTGGWISQGLVSATTSGAAQGFASRGLSAAVAGANDTLTYSLSAATQETAGGLASSDLRARIGNSWGRAAFEAAAERTEFRPVVWGAPYRQGTLRVDGDAFGLQAGLRAPYQYGHLSFAPEGVRGFADRTFGPGFVGAGLIGGGLDAAEKAWLPFAAAGAGSSALGASLFGGAVTGVAAHVLGAEAHGALGTCLLSAEFTSGLRGPDAAKVRDALRSYVDPNQDAFSSRGQCRAGKLMLSGGAFRGGTATQLVDPTAVVLSGSVAYTGEAATVYGTGQWSTRGQDLRNFASAFGQLMVGKFSLSSTVGASRPADSWNFNESATARRLLGAGSVGVSVGTAHATALPRAGWVAVDGQVQSASFRAAASLSANLAASLAPLLNGVAQLEWFPFRAYALRASSMLDLAHYRNWNLSLGFTYEFGDALPREPLLAPLRQQAMAAFAFEDLDGDGRRGANEPALPGVRICVDRDRCGLTDAAGNWTARDLEDGPHRVQADAAGVEGATATTEAEQVASAGGYTLRTVQFGFRRAGEIRVRAFIDLNGNGVRDAGEYDLDQGAAHVTGPGLDTVVPLGRGRAAFHSTGAFNVSLEVMSLPIGFAGPAGGVVVLADRFGPQVAELAVRPLRSIQGRVCVDRNGNGLCDPGELPVGFIHLSDGKSEAVTDADGNFLLRDLGPGVHSLQIAEEDWPAGALQRRAARVELGNGPGVVRGLSVPLDFAPLVKRASAREMEWGAGRRLARLVGGYYFRPRLLAGRFAPESGDAAVLARLERRAQEGDSRLSVVVYADVQVYRRDRAEALARAQAAAEEIARWLRRRVRASIRAEARSPGDHEQVAEVRVYRAEP